MSLPRILFGLAASVFMTGSVLKLFRAKPKWYSYSALLLIISLAYSTVCWVGDENPILLFPLVILAFVFCLPGEKLAKAVVGGILYTMLIPINILIDTIYYMDWSWTILVFKLLIWCALAWFLKRFAPPRGIKLPRRLWTLLGSLTLAPLATILSFSLWKNNYTVANEYQLYKELLNRLAITIMPFVFISALALLIAAVVLSKQEVLEQENQMSALREVYYTSIKQEQIQLRTLRHDLRNHLSALQGLLATDNSKEAEEYLKDLSGSMAFIQGREYTQNEIANIVLSSKALQMKSAGIEPDFSVQLPKDLPISAPELCALLGNALDNAIEGVVNSIDKTVCLRAHINKGMFMLKVQNAIGGAVNPDFSTTKADNKSHGFGLAGMREIAQRYGGTLEAEAQNEKFELLVCFPCEL